jgi:hypothetical protein
MQGHNPVALQEQAEKKALAELEAKVKAEQWADDLKWLMAHPQGRRIVWRLLEEAGVYRATFHESHAVMALNEGQRRMGLFLVMEINQVCPDRYDEMKHEQRPHGRRKQRDAADRSE